MRSSRNVVKAVGEVIAVLACIGGGAARAADLSKSYQWAPVRIGAGGWVTGFVTHPLDAKVRYCHTDVAGAYRWDDKAQEWFNMLVRNDDGSSAAYGKPIAPSR